MAAVLDTRKKAYFDSYYRNHGLRLVLAWIRDIRRIVHRSKRVKRLKKQPGLIKAYGFDRAVLRAYKRLTVVRLANTLRKQLLLENYGPIETTIDAKPIRLEWPELAAAINSSRKKGEPEVDPSRSKIVWVLAKRIAEKIGRTDSIASEAALENAPDFLPSPEYVKEIEIQPSKPVEHAFIALRLKDGSHNLGRASIVVGAIIENLAGPPRWLVYDPQVTTMANVVRTDHLVEGFVSICAAAQFVRQEAPNFPLQAKNFMESAEKFSEYIVPSRPDGRPESNGVGMHLAVGD